MKKVICVLVCNLILLLSLSATAFTCPKEVVDEAILTNDFETIFVDYFFPSLTPAEILVFGAELNISNGRPQNENGERYMFGRLESAGSVVDDANPEVYSERVRDEVIRLLFGNWVKPGNTTMTLKNRKGVALNLSTAKWNSYCGRAILINHVTEYFGGKRSRLLTFDYDGLNLRITILRTK